MGNKKLRNICDYYVLKKKKEKVRQEVKAERYEVVLEAAMGPLQAGTGRPGSPSRGGSHPAPAPAHPRAADRI